MNKTDRAELQKALDMIIQATEIVRSVGEQEQEKFDNLTEGLQASERGQRFEEIASQLSNATDTLETVHSDIEAALE